MSAAETERRERPPLGASRRHREQLRALIQRHGLTAGVALIVGTILRLLWLGDTSFLGDQAQLLAVARSAADHHAIIITGIPSSIGTLNPPASTWLYGPLAIIGGPLGATIFTALANIAAIALVYALATRYVSRRAGFAAALLYATASGPIHYARFIWQQNLLAPVTLLLLWVILRAVIERRRGWLGWSALLWGIATELHPTAAPLLALIAVALAFTWRAIRPRDIAWAAIALIGLFGPTALWEIVSHGADLLNVQHFSQGRAIFDTWALTYLQNLISPAPANWLGASSGYTLVGQALSALDPVLLTLILAAQARLFYVLVEPWTRRRAGRPHADETPTADARWRSALCLALWEAAPLALMLRHTRPVEPHYLLVLLPAAYLSMGILLAWLSVWIERALAARWPSASRARLATTITLGALLIALSAAQAVGVTSELATIHSGAFDGLALPLHYGAPLSSEQAALEAMQTTARQSHATIAIASTRVEQEPLGYLNATDANYVAATDYISDGCIALPDAGARASLVTLALPTTTAARLLPHISGARMIRSVKVLGGAPYQLYTIAPGATTAGEQAITAAAPSGRPHPVAYAYAAEPNNHLALTIRWVGAPTLPNTGAAEVSYWYGADPRGAPIANYTFTVQALDAQGQAIDEPLTSVCARLGWSRQLSLVTATRLTPALLADRHIAGWRVTAQMALAVATRPKLGPLPLETGAITFGPTQSLSQPVTFAAALP